MQVITVFAGYPPRPMITAIYDGKVEVVPLYLKGTKRSLYDVHKDIDAISERISTSEYVLLNDAKSHLQSFDIQTLEMFQINPAIPPGLNLGQYKRLFNALLPLKVEKDYWRRLIAMASTTYAMMESRPIYVDEKRVYPRYSLDTFSGRSRCTNFNIQGAPEDIPIKADGDLFVCLDWVSADLRVAAAMSGDENLTEMFRDSDPYSNIAGLLKIPRSECKILLLRTLYALDLESAILDLFPTLKKWIENKLIELETTGYLTSLLGRPFRLKTRDQRSVFNATLQGTVAHAMQSVLWKIQKDLGRFLLTETHDSVVFVCNRIVLTKLLRLATPIMNKPLDKLPRLPFKAYIGKEWKRWKLYKAYK